MEVRVVRAGGGGVRLHMVRGLERELYGVEMKWRKRIKLMFCGNSRV